MKKRTIPWACFLLLLAYFPLTSQNPGSMPLNTDPYENAWKEIDSLDREGLPRSALEKVTDILARAKADNYPAQQAKAAIRMGHYTSQLSEDGPEDFIAFMEKELAAAAFPLSAIYQSVLGELYMNYLTGQLWRIRERESTTGDPGQDIKTWSVEQLLEKSTAYFLASVDQPDRLLELPIESFDAITIDGKNADNLRPTLFDFLAHRAIDHFTNDITYITQPAYQFTIQDEQALAPAAAFVQHDFLTEDETAFPYISLKLLQRVLRSHLADRDPSALVDADLRRLELVHEKAVLADKDTIYLKALENLARQYEGHPVFTEIMAQWAQFKLETGNRYQSEKATEYRWAIKNAYELCQKAIEKFPKSYGAINCQNLQRSIREKQLELKIERVNVPVQPSLLWVGYTNIPEVYVQIFHLEDLDEFEQLEYDDRISFINRQKALRSWPQKLPDAGDYQFHSVELAIPVLDIGQYAIVVSDTRKINQELSKAEFITTTVSQLAYLQRHSSASRQEFVVVDRSSGAPVPRVKAEFFTRLFNRQKQAYELNKVGEALSDDNGFIRQDLGDNVYFRLKLSRGQDELFFDEGYSNYNRSQERKDQQILHFFTDRAIYRPGQTLYFKAILLEKDAETQHPRILTGETVTVTLHDTNGQEISSQELTSNDYGSIHGNFITPTSGLLGQFYLRSSNGSTHYFRVEEYKRPRFEVTFDPLDQQPQLDEEVRFHGKAEGFAGDQLQDATVQYRVVREVRYPWLPWWKRSSFPFPGRFSPNMEIAHGSAKTDEGGKFTITFEAKSDPSADRKNDPAFIFTVYADVTDVTGETHSGQKSIQLARLGLQANIQAPNSSDRQDPLKVQVTTQNLDGQPQATRGRLVIERLLAPAHPYISRYWERPDYHVIDREAFNQQFPLFPYEDEDEPHTWPALGSLYDQEINTGDAQSIEINAADWPVGHYRLTFSTRDSRGQEITAQTLFQLFDRSSKQIPTDQWLWTKLDKDQYEPKDLANLAIASSIENWHLLYEIDRNYKETESPWLHLQKWLDMHELVQEKDRGNFYLKLASVRYNRPFSTSLTVSVPWTNKQLQVEYSTFRDKLRPGEKEEWQIKISGPTSEQIAAEMVAAMYDASLDQFVSHHWNFSPFPTYYMDHRSWQGAGFSDLNGNGLSNPKSEYLPLPERNYRRLDWPSRYYGRGGVMNRMSGNVAMMEATEETVIAKSSAPPAPAPPGQADEADALAATTTGVTVAKDSVGGDSSADPAPAPITPRTNLNETVFFMPELKTDEEGNILISFTMNEALTRWKFLSLAHTRELAYAISEKEVITQKELMVLPSPPRFFREGDDIVFASKLSNLTEGALAGTAQLELFDALSMKPVDAPFENDQPTVNFQTTAKGSTGLEWKLKVPKNNTSAIIYRVTARAGNFSDGEESALPVLTNRMLVTESKPLAVNGGESRTFELDRFRETMASTTAEPHQLTVEFTSNPAWYAVQALPYLMEYPYECTEQIFNRYYANALASSAANKYPKIRDVFIQWRDEGQKAMLSNLRKNQDLKALLLEETPWVLAAKTEEEQKQNIGLLFDLDRMSREEEATLLKLVDRQGEDGSFSWFPGGNSSWHMTQYVLEGMGRLQKLGVADPAFRDKTSRITLAGMGYIDRQLREQYAELKKLVDQQKAKWEDDHLNSLTIHYLYTRSLFDIPVEEDLREIIDYYLGQAQKYWLDKGLYQQGLIALAMAYRQKPETPERILASLQERALHHDDLGMYWKYPNSWFWHQLPIETHALLIEVFCTLHAPADQINGLKIWLLKNKQTNHWPTTTATAAAVYALLNHGDNWLAETQELDLRFSGWSKGTYSQKLETAQASAEAGTGYFNLKWQGSEIQPDLKKIRVKNPNKGPAWGAVYWQYFEDLDKITSFEETPLTLKKQLFLEKPGDRGPVLEPVAEGEPLAPGSKLVVRLELRVDREMEYVHMKDTRAAGLEPINVLSQYRWQDGLGYYESPGDAATNFFIDHLPAGTYVFEYPLRVTYKGEFSNGITSIQCMYAPEFSSHSQGGRISVK